MENKSSIDRDEISLKELMQKAGFKKVDYYNLTAGVAALHKGYKI